MNTMLRTILAVTAAVTAAGISLPATAAAQMRCGERETVIAQLRDRYGETQRSAGFQEGRGIVEIYANEDSGSWTILLTTPEGVSCLMAAGEAWRQRLPGSIDTPA